eukprot:TRINITY_DN16910_c0_g1_i1.p1 TRINITY_DN16910_c0_g1~~TRINITY_DN16910_c0_g1_i1.p1  ORF type:complete len:343 (+),score=69.72 TRINITY_DN16910_c0_g1_i1:254-1282(+)
MAIGVTVPLVLCIAAFAGCLLVLQQLSRQEMVGVGVLELPGSVQRLRRRVLEGQNKRAVLRKGETASHLEGKVVANEEGGKLLEQPSYVNDVYAATMRLGIVRPQILSWIPKVMLLDDFLSVEECLHLIAHAQGQLVPSTVVDIASSDGVMDDWRNSSNYFLSEREEVDDITAPIMQRISLYTQTPLEYGEPTQILRYKNGQFYLPHEDFIYSDKNESGGRQVTVLMYLTDDVVGGETWFVNATGNCSCGGETVPGLSVTPKRGRAVVFWNMLWNGQPDPTALHAGCRVVSGVKWSATKWIGTAPLDEGALESSEEGPSESEDGDQGNGDGAERAARRRQRR